VSGDPSDAEARRRPHGAALGIALFLVALAAVVAWDAYRLPAGIAAYARIGPRTVPYAVAIVLALLGIATGVSAFRGRHSPREPIEIAPVIWVVAGLVLQIALLRPFGFSIATGAVFAFTARAFGRRPLWLSYPLGVLIALAVWLGFALALKLVLPTGWLEHTSQSALVSLIDAIRAALGFG
jgi:putative tricarboxylic transport membrane protein